MIQQDNIRSRRGCTGDQVGEGLRQGWNVDRHIGLSYTSYKRHHGIAPELLFIEVPCIVEVDVRRFQIKGARRQIAHGRGRVGRVRIVAANLAHV